MKQFHLYFTSLICLLLFCHVLTSEAQKNGAVAANSVKLPSSYIYKIIKGNNNTFGYDIYAEKNLLIHQPAVPAMPGNNGFTTKARAEKVALLVIKKIKNGEMPPTVDIPEMNNLKAL